MNRIELKELSKRYGKKLVLNGLNLTVRQGEIYGLIGKNGAGKQPCLRQFWGSRRYRAGVSRLTVKRRRQGFVRQGER